MPPNIPYVDPNDPAARLVEDFVQRANEMASAGAVIPNYEQPVAPSPPRPPGLGRQILGGIGDALTAAAAVRAGGTPPRIGAFAGEMQRQQEEYRLAYANFLEERRDLNNKIAEMKAEAEQSARDNLSKEMMSLRKELLSDALTSRRQAEDDAREAQKQKENDERDANIAIDKWVKSEGLKLAARGIDVGDPTKLTLNKLFDLAEQNGGVELSPEERLAAQSDLAKSLGLQPTGVNFSGPDGKPNLIARPNQLSTVSGVDARRGQLLGVDRLNEDLTPKPPEQFLAELAAAEKVEKAKRDRERDARLASRVGRRGNIGEKISEHLTLLQNAQIALDVLRSTSSAPGGRFAGRVPASWRYSVISLFSQKEADINREVTIRIQNLFNVVAKIRSGAAVTLPEEIRLLPELANMKDSKETMMKKLELLVEFENRAIDNIRTGRVDRNGVSGMPGTVLEESDIDYMSDSMTSGQFIHSQTDPGEVILLGGDE